MKLGDVGMVKDCMICRRDVILLARKNSKGEMPPKGAIMPRVCKECRSKYLTAGVLLVNPDTCALVVLKDEAFKGIFNVPIPAGKIAFTEQAVLDKLNEQHQMNAKRKKASAESGGES